MVSMHLAAVVLAVSGVGDTVLFDFQSTRCGPCRSMEPVVAQLTAQGYPVRKVDVDREPDLAARFGVGPIPCFILVVDGREVDRTVGATSFSTLEGMFAKAGVKSHGTSDTPIARGQSPDPLPRRISSPWRNARGPLTGNAANARPRGPADPFAARSAKTEPSANAAGLLEASVRLTIEDANGYSYGSGTLIDSRGGEALVLTCGHIFRDSGGKGKITVDVFSPAPQKLSGQLVSYDLKRDIGLVAIRPTASVTAARVADKEYRVARGDKVISIGCNNGGQPTVIPSQVTAVDKFSGPANVEVAGQPVQGRSGGGLFSGDGIVIGVCNAADPADNEGLFAAAETIRNELDRSGLSALYESQTKGTAETSLAAVPASTRGAPTMPNRMPPSDLEDRPLAAAVPTDMRVTSAPTSNRSKESSTADRARAALNNASAQGAEVICVVRSLADSKGKSEVIVLDRVSSEFLQQLAAERQAQEGRRLTSLEVPRSSAR